MTRTTSCESFEDCVAFRSQITGWTYHLWYRVADIIAAQGTRQDSERSDGCSYILPTAPESSSLQQQQVTVRPLYKSELEILRANRNRIQDGSHQFLVHPANQRLDPSLLFQHVYDNVLENGIIVWMALSITSLTEATIERNKIRNSILHVNVNLDGSTISNSYIGPNVVVHRSRLLLSDEESHSTSAKSTTNHLPISSITCQVGAESGGGRILQLTSESTMADIGNQLMSYNRRTSSSSSSDAPNVNNNSDTKLASLVNYITTMAQIQDARLVHGVFCFPQSSIHAASAVSHAVLYPQAYIGTNVIVRQCLLQWHGHIVDQSVVSQSLLMEHAIVGPQSRVNESVLGPDVHVSCGEIHATVLGPNTNAHHQSLLIGMIWLCGRGNVGYGANVGSNHTGRCPDQEVMVGEGVFWGLSCIVKLPVYLAPYTIVAAGTIVPPQRMTMPFSLLVSSPHNSSSKNQLLPGWVLGSSPYTVARAIIKLASRRKAYRHETGWEIFRPSIIQQCVISRDSLRMNDPSGTDVMGAGDNEVSDKARMTGVRAYTDCIQRYALHGLLLFLTRSLTAKSNPNHLLQEIASEFQGLVRLEASELPGDAASGSKSNKVDAAEWETLPWLEETSVTKVWTYQKDLLQQEFPFFRRKNHDDATLAWIRKLLEQLRELESKYAANVYECKRRDDTRGKMTIPGYEESHVAADQDPVVQSVRQGAENTIQTVETILKKISSIPVNPESKL